MIREGYYSKANSKGYKYKEFKKTKIVFSELLKEHHTWVYPILGSLFIIASIVIKVIESLCYKTISNYYGVDFSLVVSNENIFYYGALGILLTIIISVTLVNIIYRVENKKVQISSLCLSIIGNLIILYLLNNKFNFLFLFVGIGLSIFEYVFYFVLISFDPFIAKKTVNLEKDMKFELIFIAIIIAILCFGISAVNLTKYSLTNNHEYRFITDSQVIVYSNQDYYITLNCKIEEDRLLIYKGSQLKVSNQDINTYIQDFSDVQIIRDF